ncbi:MAG: response regulator transcription factor [Helicobacteraceae bacterium]|nr:response regulator transcription factor [Helicobacteraceae bacterium]
MQILLLEDDQDSAKALGLSLKKEHFICDVAASLKEADDLLQKASYDLLILDWNLPDGEGIDLLKEIRSYDNDTPILMLSARNDVNDKVIALDNGADDYLSKPFSYVELLARIRTLLRRNASVKTNVIVLDNVTIDLKARELSVDGRSIDLTAVEFDILSLLMRNKNRVLSRFDIVEHISKDFDSMKMSNIVDVHIKNIRAKIAPANIIKTVRGIGYKVHE